MSALKDHGEKIVFAVVLVASLGFLGMTFSTSEPPVFAQLQANKERIGSQLETALPSPKYQYSQEAIDKIAKTKDRVEKNLNRADSIVGEGPQFAVYPQPMRPAFAEGTKPLDADKLMSHEFAVLGNSRNRWRVAITAASSSPTAFRRT